MVDNTKPNHFHDDSLGDPAMCWGDHNHPERTAEEQDFVDRLERADAARAELFVKITDLIVESAVGTLRLDPYQKGRVPGDYKPVLDCPAVQGLIYQAWAHGTNEVYEMAFKTDWARK